MSLLSLDRPHMQIYSKFENAFPFGYLETELNAAGEYFFYVQ